MKGLKPFLSLGLGILALTVLAGCAGSVPQNGPGALVIDQFTLQQGVVGVAYRQLLIASGGLPPYTWTLSSGHLPPGLSLSTDGVLSGTPTTAGNFQFSAKVTDSQTPVAAYNTYTTTLPVNPVLSLTSSPLPPAIVGSIYSTTITASDGLPPYIYTVALGSLPDGLSLDQNTGVISGTPTNAGVFNFTLQATDTVSETATAAFTLTVVGRLQGNYTLNFNGFENGQPFYLVGSFIADGNGNITSGVLDRSDASGASNVVLTTDSSYTIPAGSNLGTVRLASAQVTYVFDIALSNTTDSKIVLVSDTLHSHAWGSGQVKKQSSMALPPGGANYSFGFFGNDLSGDRYAGAGMFALGTVSGNSQPVTGGVEDTNDNGTASGELSITSGSFTLPDATTGRGTFSLDVTVGGNDVTYNYAYYVVSTTELVAVETDTGSPLSILSILQQQSAGLTGLALCKTDPTTPTCQSVVEINGVSTSGGTPAPDAAIGVTTYDSSGNISRQGIDDLAAYYLDESVGGTLSTVSYDSGTYSIDATCGPITTACGRITVNLDGAPSQPIWYLVAPGQAFVIGTDANVVSGTLQPQSGTPFKDQSILGSYLGGTITPVQSSITNLTGVATTVPSKNGSDLRVISDMNGPNGPLSNQTFSGPYDCGTPGQTDCSAIGGAFGRFEVTMTTDTGSPVVSILYIVGGGTAGATGGKTGLVVLNVGIPQSDGTTTVPDPNPVLSTFGR